MTGKGLIASQGSLRWQEWKGHYDSETHAPKDMPGLGCPEGDYKCQRSRRVSDAFFSVFGHVFGIRRVPQA